MRILDKSESSFSIWSSTITLQLLQLSKEQIETGLFLFIASERARRKEERKVLADALNLTDSIVERKLGSPRIRIILKTVSATNNSTKLKPIEYLNRNTMNNHLLGKRYEHSPLDKHSVHSH